MKSKAEYFTTENKSGEKLQHHAARLGTRWQDEGKKPRKEAVGQWQCGR